jgi:hypothetical protein
MDILKAIGLILLLPFIVLLQCWAEDRQPVNKSEH